jgi:DNA/RNA endonuclease YhcR with UshA esterase domain
MRWLRRIFSVSVILAPALLVFASGHSPQNSTKDSSMDDLPKTGDPAETCLAVADAQKHIGRTNCVTGTVVRVEQGNNGVTYLDFCADYHSCPFTVVVFRADLRSVGDVRQLQGRTIIVKGRIEEYDDRAEIILRHPQQLGEKSRLTALPKDYDVEREGHYSVGTFRPAKSKKAKRKNEGAPVAIEDVEGP